MVISVELSAQIQRLYQAEQWRVGTIAAQLHVHRDTVRRVLAQAGLPAPVLPLRPSRVDRYRPFILETLAKFPTLTAARLFVTVNERGYRGSPEHFRHVIAGMRPRPAAEASCACARCRANRRKSTGATSASCRSGAHIGL